MASTPLWFGQLLANNGKDLDMAVDILLKYINNILAHPDDQKYRCIRVENKTFQAKVMPVRGSVDCLKAMGFEQDPDYIVLPRNADLAKLTAMQQSLKERRYVAPVTSPSKLSIAQRLQMHSVPPQQTQQFLQRVSSSSEHVMVYEDPNLQSKARSCIPVERLKQAAQESARDIAELAGGSDAADNISQQECLLLELMHWFKEEFFSWCDSPECDRCGAPPTQMQSSGVVPPTSDDLRYGASTVEAHRCKACGSTTRFPRYNHPGKLLETRRGRCGEWANCFTLCCRAMGFEARHVVDWTDHVWAEVFSDRQQRWLHCDPCEDCCDKPLLYEGGWGKPLSYVIAFSCEEAVDVTWRYTAKIDDVCGRRVLCDERALQRCLDGLRTQRQRSLSMARRQTLAQRSLVEAAEFLAEKSVGDDVAGQGRVSGSAAWRLARGETTEVSTASGQTATVARPTATASPNYLFEPLESDLTAFHMRVRYSAASDSYYRQHGDALSRGDAPLLRGWKSGVFMANNIRLKVENDWKKAYLARKDGAHEASITWTIDLSSSSLVVSRAAIHAEGSVFESGAIVWSISADNGALVEFDEKRQGGAMDELTGATMITVTANLSGGNGQVAWQHTQLFRQSSEEKLTCPLDIDLHLKNE